MNAVVSEKPARVEVDAPGVYTMRADDYHADPCPEPSLSASIGKILIAESPAHAWTAHPRLNVNHRPKESDAFDLGSAAHALLLEGADRMTVIDYPDFRTNAAKAARDAARAAGRHPVLADKYRAVEAMVAEAKRAIARCEDLSGITLDDGVAERVLVWREGARWCRARIDWMANERDLVLDYKTTSASANPLEWTRTMMGQAGDFQGAFYLRGNAATGGRPDAKFAFIVQETVPPYACAIAGLSPAFLALGAAKVRQAIAEWHACMTSKTWPAFFPRIFWMEPPTWELTRWEERQIANGVDPSTGWGDA